MPIFLCLLTGKVTGNVFPVSFFCVCVFFSSCFLVFSVGKSGGAFLHCELLSGDIRGVCWSGQPCTDRDYENRQRREKTTVLFVMMTGL